jgi:hypothetical protein
MTDLTATHTERIERQLGRPLTRPERNLVEAMVEAAKAGCINAELSDAFTRLARSKDPSLPEHVDWEALLLNRPQPAP